MKILQINNYHHPFSGTERYYFDLSKLLTSKGHKVAYFSMDSPKNIQTVWSRYFVSNLSLKEVKLYQIPGILNRIIYSLESKSKIARLLDDFKPDIAHIHTIDLYLSPSILPELEKRRIPIVYTLHNYQLIAPTSGSMFHEGKICEITKQNDYYKAVIHKCIRHSYLASGIYALKQYLHRFMRIYDKVDLFIAPCLFIRKKFEEFGFGSDKILHMPYFVNQDTFKSRIHTKGNYILYFGRLSSEKGVIPLIYAIKRLPKIPLKIVGSGPQLDEISNCIRKYNLHNIEIIPRKDHRALATIIGNSRFTIVPSIWNDVFPLSIMESFSCAKTVVASEIGGIPELVKNRKTGLLTKPGDDLGLSRKILSLWQDDNLRYRLSCQAYEFATRSFAPEIHYTNMMKIYISLTQRKPPPSFLTDEEL